MSLLLFVILPGVLDVLFPAFDFRAYFYKDPFDSQSHDCGTGEDEGFSLPGLIGTMTYVLRPIATICAVLALGFWLWRGHHRAPAGSTAEAPQNF